MGRADGAGMVPQMVKSRVKTLDCVQRETGVQVSSGGNSRVPGTELG